ncbi:17708_t:CDS:1, partial [Entrophospora sp. SA101]
MEIQSCEIGKVPVKTMSNLLDLLPIELIPFITKYLPIQTFRAPVKEFYTK